MTDASSLRRHGATLHGTRSGRGYAPRGCMPPGFMPQGFTLIELLVTVAVAAILLGIAMPAFSSFVQNSRLTTEADTLLYDLNFARSEAVKLDTAVEVCASADGSVCGGTWTQGWIVVCPADCPPGLGAAPAVLLVAPALNTGNNAAEMLAAAPSVSFMSAGQTGGGDLQFVFCDNRGTAFGRDVEINPIGGIAASSTPGQTVSGEPLGACPG